ncbi:tetratricopeptide (TPR) repeat protein [Catalinimonas alkaloidigena]|uniref:RagB/SusD family nutrient uptake outer membrane protein n=1 Tax=Catalinimonas alkaloidigena TaxID=1075417 RepID=UPI0024071B66|nr:RagB/SusD family nutrient uptake outer membrane protein [Catalinimonas alkaloidigena]MDF9797794.1 tetratricopeptide (TPR) repeat protein [Catalinimonas alkaloidigena]
MKFSIYKKIASLTLTALLAATVSCNEELLEQTNPNALTPSTFWRNAEDATKGIIGAYSPFTDIWYYSRMHIFVSDYRDDIVNGFATSDRTNPGRFAGTSDQNAVLWVWSAIWKSISRTNEVLANVPEIEMDEGLKNNILGEAYFLRAYNYFELLKNWLNVPLITEPVTSIEESSTVSQASPEQVWEQVIADLKQAQSLLPESWDGGNLGRATTGSATALLGKAYLFTEEYDQASMEFQKIISSSQYSLVVDYADNFSAFTENNQESLFEVQFIADENRGWGGDAAGIGRTNSFTPDIAPPPAFTGQDGMRINNWVLDLFLDERTVDGQIDPRAFITLFWDTEEITVYEGDTLAATIYDGKTFQEVFPGDERVFGKKYLEIDQGFSTANFQQSSANLRLIRYADVLLMFAEAEMMANGGSATQEAVDAVNQVRSRVNMPPLDMSMSIQDIRDERVKELALERVRYYDLLRWDMVKEKIVDTPGIKSESGGTGLYQPGREYLDLPQNELNNNSNLKHNPGYN